MQDETKLDEFQRNVICCTCNKARHIAKYWRRKNNDPVNRGKSDEKGKVNVEEIRENHEKMWGRKHESKIDNGFAHESSAGSSSGN